VRRFDDVLAIAEAHDEVFCSVGTHPHNAAEEPDVTVADLVKLARHQKVAAIGEAGLDYHYDNSPRPDQEKSFRVHIAAARETRLPLVIHAREADADIARILEEESAKGAFPFVLHCFTSGPELARRGLAIGGFVSFSGVVTLRSRMCCATLHARCRLIGFSSRPMLLISRRSPCAAKPNEPAFVVHTAARLAAVKGVSEADLARATNENFFRLFNKVPRTSLKTPKSAA
jgi:TatD DNase family protein